VISAWLSRFLGLDKAATTTTIIIALIVGVLCLLAGLFLIALGSILHPILIDDNRAIFKGAGRSFLDKLERRQPS
jgi:hypothetical protein